MGPPHQPHGRRTWSGRSHHHQPHSPGQGSAVTSPCSTTEEQEEASCNTKRRCGFTEPLYSSSWKPAVVHICEGTGKGRRLNQNHSRSPQQREKKLPGFFWFASCKGCSSSLRGLGVSFFIKMCHQIPKSKFLHTKEGTSHT